MSPGTGSTKATRRTARPLLVLGPAGEADEVQVELRARPDFQLISAATMEDAVSALQDPGVSLVVISAEAPTAWIEDLLAAVARLSPQPPVLAVRDRNAEEPPTWRDRGLGVLRRPLVPHALTRSIDVVLGLKNP